MVGVVTHAGTPGLSAGRWQPGRRPGLPDAGQGLFIPALVVAVVVVVAMTVTHLGAVASDRAQARTAADAAALAAAMAGPDAARWVAAANGATLESVTVTPDGAHVGVRVGRATATAQAGIATADSGAVVPGGPVDAP